MNLKRYREVILTSVLDFLIFLASWYVFHSYYNTHLDVLLQSAGISLPVAGIFVSVFWVFVFVIVGLYKRLYLISRLDEFLKVMLGTGVGVLTLFFFSAVIFDLNISGLKEVILQYMAIFFVMAAGNRFVIRTVQKIFAMRGKGLHRSVIIGTGPIARNACDDLLRNKTLGMQVIGFIQVNGQVYWGEGGVKQDEILGHLDDISSILEEYSVQDILVALEPDKREELVEVISKVDLPEISLKLLPDFYQVVSGLAKTNQLFGLPIVEVSPVPLSLSQRFAKRLFDILVAFTLLIVLLPALIVFSILIRSTSPGPAIFRQKRIGLMGRPFTMYKFRTMYEDAEKLTGPVWAQKDDPRITPVGRFLRKTRLDEVPQLWNVLKGDMSLIGPRPERPHFVQQFTGQVPLYSRRHRVRPGITGWAQVKWKYDTTLDDVKEKTKFDLFYVENISLIMDTKILINTLLTMIKAKGQ